MVQKYANYNVYNDTMISVSKENTVRENILQNSRTTIYNSTELQEYHELLKVCYLKMRMEYG